ncbi:putative ankyrin repeat protein [Megavirus vitis]|uniref:Putative ankyrin repeat protein n=1 Tax=Megavirus courdo7 TaxID=1128135 RepID=H2ECA6_9VIRU|nr:putative ankyrin repeat protein [Megavirus courdo7]AVL94264.1 putative ankyrin repeat protein [Megavirus vitis]
MNNKYNRYEKLFNDYLPNINNINDIDEKSGHTALTLLCDYYLICLPKYFAIAKYYSVYNCNKSIIYDLIESLINQGANVNQPNAQKLTPLLTIATKRTNPVYLSVVKLLLKRGANINAVDMYGNSALMLACSQNDVELAELLIRSGIDVNIKSNCNMTALISAAYNSGHNNNIDLIKLLLEHGADVNFINIYGRTALDAACDYKNKCDNLQTIKLLLDHWCDVNIKNENGYNALMIACQYPNSLDTIKLLIDYWSDLCTCGINGCDSQCEKSAIGIAKSKDNRDIVDYLYNHINNK